MSILVSGVIWFSALLVKKGQFVGGRNGYQILEKVKMVVEKMV